jgi:hypothetical protein
MQRIAVVFVMLLGGVVAAQSAILSEIGYGLSFAALILVSFGTVFAVSLGAANALLAASWLIPYSPNWQRLHHGIVFLNRQAGHLAFFVTWTVIALAWKPYLYLQLPLVAVILLFGEWLVDAAARALVPGAASADAADFLWIRRPFFYLGTILGGVTLVMLAPAQVDRIVPLFGAIGVGTALRFLKLATARMEARSNRFSTAAERSVFRQQQAGRFASKHDKWLPWALVVGLAALVLAGRLLRRQAEAKEAEPTVRPPPSCLREAGGPVGPPEIGLFIVADTQLHELRGPRYAGQEDLMGAFVPVAIRPVELDTLSAPTLLHFRDLYREIQRDWPLKTPVAWTHLGDFGDSGCAGELLRFGPLFEALETVGPLAGVAPGNHDSAFTGNFGWHPDWDVACPSGHLDKTASDASLRRLLAPIARRTGARMLSLDKVTRWGWLKGAQTALATVTPLGIAHDRSGARGLVAVFLDTSDRRDSDLLVAGSRGTVSDEQVARVKAEIAALREELGGPYRAHPAYLVLFHHPLAELNGRGRAAIVELGAFLDGAAQPGAGPHLLGLISAHTHSADTRPACVGGRRLQELVVGSTIDPPQQAAMLTVGADAQGDLSLRLQTIQSVERPGTACGGETAPTTSTCRALVRDLVRYPDCRPLVSGAVTPDPAAPSCDRLEQVLPAGQRILAVAREKADLSPTAIREQQWNRADLLLACICRATGCTPPADSLDERRSGQVLDQIFDTAAEPNARDRDVVTCLSWAAAAEQRYKAAGMQMEDAVRCAFDDPGLPPPREFIESLDDRRCP